MPDAKFLQDLTGLTNDLSKFEPLGILFAANIPSSPAKPLDSPDGFGWCDFPYNYGPTAGLSRPMADLRYLEHRAFIRVTYKVFLNGLAVARVYVLPSDERRGLASAFREHYVTLRKRPDWHRRASRRAISRLLSILDFSKEAWGIDDEQSLSKYLRAHSAALINCKGLASVEDLVKEVQLENIDLQRLTMHLSQTNPRCLVSSELGKESLQDRVARIYSEIQSPSLNLTGVDEDDRPVVESILSDDVPGMKSNLYPYQRRSVATMYCKENRSQRVPMPSVVTISPGKLYLNLSTFQFMRDPSTYWQPRGGILAENMGLGKTCICLALICMTKYEISETPVSYQTAIPRHARVRTLADNCVDLIARSSIPWKKYSEEGSLPGTCVSKLAKSFGFFDKIDLIYNKHYSRRTTRGREADDGFEKIIRTRLYLSATTLAVIPDNLFNQWQAEIKKHTEDGYLTVVEIPNVRAELPHDVNTILKSDLVLISLNAFSRQANNPDSILRSIYWKRIIVDEGHSMNSKTSRAVDMASNLYAERKWTITGTPTSGLTNLHMTEQNGEYVVKKQFDAKQDLAKLGVAVGKFLQIEPWKSSPKLWQSTVIKPLEQGQFHSDFQLSELLRSLIVRHSMKDVEEDVQLPKLDHRAIFLQPSFFDKLSVNLFTAVLATNAVTSERTGQDYMFDPLNRSDLRRLINNLQKATFYWTGFSMQDVENLLKICDTVIENKDKKYSETDINLIRHAIYVSKVALSNPRWRTNSSVHEMGYYVSDLPPPIAQNFTTATYSEQSDDFGNATGVYGFPQLIAIQRFFYKHRLVKSIPDLAESLKGYTSEFWEQYGKTNDKMNGVKRQRTPTSSELDFKEIDYEAIKEIGREPNWVDEFDPEEEEQKLRPAKRQKLEAKPSTPVKQPLSWDGENTGLQMREAKVLGTASVKLSYLTARLLESQRKRKKSIVFYEFENSAYYLTEFLDVLGANYIMYSPHIKPAQRSANLKEFDEWDTSVREGTALIMDLRLASHGLTILAAEQVFFINPVWNKTVEAQAVKRAHRIGQTHEVHVETLLLRDTIEQEMYYRRADTTGRDIVDAKEHDAIDNTGIQDYVLRFDFLPMYSGAGSGRARTSEIAQVEAGGNLASGPSDPRSYKYKAGEQPDREEEQQQPQGIQMYTAQSVKTGAGALRWTLPLFTEASMEKLAESDGKKQTKRPVSK